MNTTLKLGSLALLSAAALRALPASAQYLNNPGYEDYGAFATDPVDLDTEVSELFGRFFQNSFHVGTTILTGGLGKAYAAGVAVDVKFIFYFDKIWAGELSAGWGQHAGAYNSTNTSTKNIDVQMKMSMVPLALGIRYGFDQDALPRGFAVLNPYLSANVEYVFRTEAVVLLKNNAGITPSALRDKFADQSKFGTNGAGVNIGGGIEFDVYRKKLLIGLDLRYHQYFWSDANVLVGKLGRDGNGVSILGSMTYNY